LSYGICCVDQLFQLAQMKNNCESKFWKKERYPNSRLIVLPVVLACKNARFPAKFEHVAMDDNHSVPDPMDPLGWWFIYGSEMRLLVDSFTWSVCTTVFHSTRELPSSPSSWCTINTLWCGHWNALMWSYFGSSVPFPGGGGNTVHYNLVLCMGLLLHSSEPGLLWQPPQMCLCLIVLQLSNYVCRVHVWLPG